MRMSEEQLKLAAENYIEETYESELPPDCISYDPNITSALLKYLKDTFKAGYKLADSEAACKALAFKVWQAGWGIAFFKEDGSACDDARDSQDCKDVFEEYWKELTPKQAEAANEP